MNNYSNVERLSKYDSRDSLIRFECKHDVNCFQYVGAFCFMNRKSHIFLNSERTNDDRIFDCSLFDR